MLDTTFNKFNTCPYCEQQLDKSYNNKKIFSPIYNSIVHICEFCYSNMDLED